MTEQWNISTESFWSLTDETLSSTDSPVLKPPKLKEFRRGETVYKHQAMQVHVLPSNDFDGGPS